MNNENNNEKFSYTYSAKEQNEIKSIREKYLTEQRPEESKLQRLKHLDDSVTNRATVASLVIGIVSIIIMGLGMSLIMTDIGAALGTTVCLILGIAVGIVGMIGVAFAYPIYSAVLKRERNRVAPEILLLLDELENGK